MISRPHTVLMYIDHGYIDHGYIDRGYMAGHMDILILVTIKLRDMAILTFKLYLPLNCVSLVAKWCHVHYSPSNAILHLLTTHSRLS